MKGCKYFLLLLSITAWASARAETLPEAEPSAEPDYVYIKRNKPTQKVTERKDTLQVTQIQEKTIEIKTEETCSLPVNNKIEEEKEETSNQTEVIGVIKEGASAKSKGEVEEFKREIESVEFIPKGQWIFGLSVSYTQSSQDKYQFLILEGITADTYSFKISPMVMFAVKADLALGGRFSYARSLTKIANADMILDAETDYGFDHLYRLSHNYYGAALMRNYFSIGRSKRFGFFNEVSLQLGGGQSKLTTGVGEDLTGTYERNFSLNVGLTPGLCIFLSNYSALEVNVGLLGFNYNETKAVKDQIYVSKRNYQSANFRINLFSITFGATFYI